MKHNSDSIQPPCTSYHVAILYEGCGKKSLCVHAFAVSGIMPLTPEEAKCRADSAIREEWAAMPDLPFDPARMAIDLWNWSSRISSYRS